MNTATGFDDAFDILMEFEGEQSFDDLGGETVFGISRTAYPTLTPWPPTKAKAKEIFRQDYWDKLELDTVAYAAALRVFLAAVNMGAIPAVESLQRALNRCGASVDVDGQLGPQSRAALSTCLATCRGDFLARLRGQLALHYCNIVLAHAGLKKFLEGWLWRAGF